MDIGLSTKLHVINSTKLHVLFCINSTKLHWYNIKGWFVIVKNA